MQIQYSALDGVQLKEIEPVCTDLIRQLPLRAMSRDSDVSARLFPAPYAVEYCQELDDWQEHVTPDLEEFFQSAVDVVEKDLGTLKTDEETGLASFIIPIENLNAWIHALTQTRLVIATGHAFTEETIELRSVPENSEAALDLFLMNYYGQLLEVFVALVQGES